MLIHFISERKASTQPDLLLVSGLEASRRSPGAGGGQARSEGPSLFSPPSVSLPAAAAHNVAGVTEWAEPTPNFFAKQEEEGGGKTL